MNTAKEYLGSLKPNEHVNIIGGGISGLAVGYYLDKANIPFTIFEKENRVGGKIQTVKNENGVFEQAANAIYSSDLIFEIISDLGLKPIPANKPLKKFVWRNNQPTSPPVSIRELIFLIPKLLKYTPDQYNIELTVADFFKPLLGPTLTHEVLAPALTGIYAEDVSNLHHLSVFPLASKNRERYFSYFRRLKKSRLKPKVPATSLSFEGGLSELINALRDRLADHIVMDSDVSTLSLNNSVIATDATDAAKIVERRYPNLAAHLNKIEYSTLSLKHCFTNYKIPYLDKAFGMVFTPNHQKRKLIGILSNDQIFPLKAATKNTYSYSFIIQGDSEVEQSLENDLAEIQATEVNRQQISCETLSWKRAIPKYNFQRFRAINDCREIVNNDNKGLVIHGNYVHGVSLREIIKNAHTLATNLAKVTT